MTQISLDTSVLIGLIDPQDTWHSAALLLERSFQERDADLVVFDCALAETISTVTRRIHEKRRSADLNQVLSTIVQEYPLQSVVWAFPSVPLLYEDIVDLIRQSQGELNFNDALIAISCRRRGISLIASFDADFDRVPWLKRVAEPDDLP